MLHIKSFAAAATLLALAVLASGGPQGAAAIDVSTLPKNYTIVNGCYSAVDSSFRYEVCFWDQITKVDVTTQSREVIGRFTSATYDANTKNFTLTGGDSCYGDIGYNTTLAVTFLSCGASSTISADHLGCAYTVRMGISRPCSPSGDDDPVSIGVGVGLGVGLTVAIVIGFAIKAAVSGAGTAAVAFAAV